LGEKEQLQITWCSVSINHTFVRVCVEEFTECDVTINQCILRILISFEECLKLEKGFKSMKEAMVKN